MVTFDKLRKLALSFPEAYEDGHFEKTAFRVKKKIFATYDAKNKRACIKLSAIDQQVFCLHDTTIIYPVPNKWGKQGWTLIEMSTIKTALFTDAITTAYCEVAPGKLSKLVRENNNQG